MGAPQARLYELAVRLQAAGHELTIITAMPNYPTGVISDEYKGRWFCRETMTGMRVIRTFIYPSKSTNPVVRLFSYFSFVLSSLLMATWFVGKQDLLIVESPPLFLGLSAWPMSLLTRSRMVMMVSDIWPDVVIRMGNVIGPRQARILERLEGFLYHRSSCVALTNPGAVEQVRSRFPDVTCSVISNGVDTEMFRPELRSEEIRREYGLKEGQFAAGYCGLHGLFQGLEVVVDAAKLLRDRSDIRFIMVGEGPTKETLIARAREAGLDNIVFYPRQPKSKIPGILASMDASLIPLAKSLPGTMPSKVYEALAAGVPIIITEGCEAEQLVRRYDVGRMFAAGDAKGLADLLVELASNPATAKRVSENALGLSRRFDRNTIAKRTDQLLRAVAAGQPVPEVLW